MSKKKKKNKTIIISLITNVFLGLNRPGNV